MYTGYHMMRPPSQVPRRGRRVARHWCRPALELCFISIYIGFPANATKASYEKRSSVHPNKRAVFVDRRGGLMGNGCLPGVGHLAYLRRDGRGPQMGDGEIREAERRNCAKRAARRPTPNRSFRSPTTVGRRPRCSRHGHSSAPVGSSMRKRHSTRSPIAIRKPGWCCAAWASSTATSRPWNGRFTSEMPATKIRRSWPTSARWTSRSRGLPQRIALSPTGEFRLHHHIGSPCSVEDYRPLETVLARGTTKRIAAAGGRPTNSDLSYFNLQRPGEGG